MEQIIFGSKFIKLHPKSENLLPGLILGKISSFLKPKPFQAKQSRLNYSLKTDQGTFQISPTGTICSFETCNKELELELEQAILLNNSLQAHIVYAAKCEISSLNDIFIELMKENLIQFPFLKDFGAYLSNLGKIEKFGLYFIALVIAVLFLMFSLWVVMKLIM